MTLNFYLGTRDNRTNGQASLPQEHVEECLKTHIPQELHNEVARSNREPPQHQPLLAHNCLIRDCPCLLEIHLTLFQVPQRPHYLTPFALLSSTRPIPPLSHVTLVNLPYLLISWIPVHFHLYHEPLLNLRSRKPTGPRFFEKINSPTSDKRRPCLLYLTSAIRYILASLTLVFLLLLVSLPILPQKRVCKTVTS
jgi:hypothetical protein